MLTLPPLSLYVHIPWCVRKCPYCDFNSHTAPEQLPEGDYLNALLGDLQKELPHLQGRKLHSIFFGGGTPSLVSAGFIDKVLTCAEKTIGFEDHIEITLEANPGTVDQQRFSGLHSAGVNRLSIGIQSFDNHQLQALGRIHDRAAAIQAVDAARRGGFDNINLDLMHGLPGQTTAAAQADLATAFQLTPEHISWYQLTLEPNTVFYSSPPTLPEEDALADIQETGESALAEAGYRQYEVSAYAQPGRHSRHNVNYWQFGDYLGIGAGAHGKISRLAENDIVRTAKTRLPQHYMARQDDWQATRLQISQQELPLEFLMNALRLKEGVASTLFEERTGLTIDTLAPSWRQLEQQGLLMPLQEQLATSPAGWRFLNLVLEKFAADGA